MRAQDRARRLRAERDALRHGTGTMPDTPAGRVAARYHHAHQRRIAAQQWASYRHPSRRVRRQAAKDLRTLVNAEALTRDDWHTTVEPALLHLDNHITHTDTAAQQAADGIHARQQWLQDHPAHTERRRHLETELGRIEHPTAGEQPDQLDQLDQPGQAQPADQASERPRLERATRENGIESLEKARRLLADIDRMANRGVSHDHDPGPEQAPPDVGLGL